MTDASDFPQIVRRLVASLAKTQYTPAEELLHNQRSLLERLIRHARAHVPFYRDTGRLDVLFKSDDTIHWENWSQVPLLTRHDIRRAGDALRSRELPPSHGEVWSYSSSGSTGESITVLHSDLSNRIVRLALQLRDFQQHQIDPTRRLALIRRYVNEAEEVRREDGWASDLPVMGLPGERFDFPVTWDPDKLVAAIISIRPDIVHARPSVLREICSRDTSNDLCKLRISAAIVVGEQCTEQARSQIEQHLGCPIVNFYSSTECGRIAMSCPHCNQFHINAEAIAVEVLNKHGYPARSEQAGSIIATPLYNYAMPLIRYDHGDEARLGQRDACKITLPALAEVFGRRIPAAIAP
jgi:phenylacetate-coenzyme A ligase PaaK-like adenylate-forming protein